MKKIGLLLGCMLLLSSCAYVPFSRPEDLLAAPQLNARQAEISAALQDTLDTGSIQYKYPQSGDFRSPFVFFDLDGDGREEAIVFYSYNDDPTNIRAKVLREGESGTWSSSFDITGAGEQVDFIEFAPMLEPDKQCIIIGWQSARRSLTLGVYSVNGNSWREEILQPYHTEVFLMESQSGGLSRILLIAEERGSFLMQLFGRGLGGKIQQLDYFPLAEDTTHLLQVLQGRLWDSSPAVFVDELLGGSITATEVVRITSRTLDPVLASGDWDDYELTFRDYEILCVDLEGDGIIEIPFPHLLPGQEENAEIAELMLTEYANLTGEGFVTKAYGVVNEEDGYLVYFPERWLDRVTVVRYPESREWRFHRLDEETDQPAGELLRIRVYSVQDYRDKFTSDYILLAENGLLQYYAYIPPQSPDEELAVAEAEVTQQFQLLRL